MKLETEKGLRAADTDLQQEIIRLLAEVMDAEDFCAALDNADDNLDGLSLDGQAIFDELNGHPQEDEETDPTISDDQLVRLHEAICENRKEDAIDVLREISGEYFRTVSEQRNLFPGRYESDAL